MIDVVSSKAQKSQDFVDLYMLHRNSGLSIKDLENGDEDKLLLVEIGDSFYEYLKECKNELIILRDRIVSSAQM